MNSHYTMIIQWSDEDLVYVVSFPEWEEQAGLIGHTHGETYESAVKAGQEMLDFLVKSQQEEGIPLPAPKVYVATA